MEENINVKKRLFNVENGEDIDKVKVISTDKNFLITIIVDFKNVSLFVEVKKHSKHTKNVVVSFSSNVLVTNFIKVV